METKQTNSQTLTKPQSSKTQVLKTPSEVSLTLSQAAEQSKINARKNPLDALSRLSLRNQGVEKRSGLNENYDHSGHINAKAQGDASNTHMQQHQLKQQSNLHLSQIHPTLSHQPMQQITENMQQQPTSFQSQNPPLPAPGKNQSYNESHLASDSRKQHQQPMQPPVAETELCTTCPNCQTTIYLVRGHETSGELAQGATGGNTASN